jgi:hypothetical protein
LRVLILIQSNNVLLPGGSYFANCAAMVFAFSQGGLTKQVDVASHVLPHDGKQIFAASGVFLLHV